MSNKPGCRCPRCGGDLPQGVNFCVACGFHNPDPALDKTAQAELEIGKRLRRLKAFFQWARALLWSRILR